MILGSSGLLVQSVGRAEAEHMLIVEVEVNPLTIRESGVGLTLAHAKRARGPLGAVQIGVGERVGSPEVVVTQTGTDGDSLDLGHLGIAGGVLLGEGIISARALHAGTVKPFVSGIADAAHGGLVVPSVVADVHGAAAFGVVQEGKVLELVLARVLAHLVDVQALSVAGAVVWAHTLAASLASVAVIAAALAGLAVTVSAVGALSIVVGSDTGLVVPARVGLGGLVGRSINPCCDERCREGRERRRNASVSVGLVSVSVSVQIYLGR